MGLKYMAKPTLGRELIEDLAAFNRKLRAVFDKIVRERSMRSAEGMSSRGRRPRPDALTIRVAMW